MGPSLTPQLVLQSFSPKENGWQGAHPGAWLMTPPTQLSVVPGKQKLYQEAVVGACVPGVGGRTSKDLSPENVRDTHLVSST